MAAVLKLHHANGSRVPQRIGALAAIALHALAAFAVLNYEPARSALLAAAPIMIDLIAPSAAEPEPEPEPPIAVPPKPKPALKPRSEPPEPRPVVAAPVEAPSPIVASPHPPDPPAPAESPAAAVPAPAAALVPVTAPIFNADYLVNPPPAYPALSRRLGEQGRVILRVLVNTAGQADEVEVRGSSGYPRLDDAARDTVRGWKFVPASRGEQPVAAWVLIPISFSLEG